MHPVKEPRRKKRGFSSFSKLLELRSPPMVDELRLHLANSDDVWKDPEALAKKHSVGMPYWSVAWAGGTVLARYVLDHPELFARRHVIDFGSGSGIAALAAARVGAKSVTAVDIDPVAGEAIAANAKANGLHVSVDIGDWLPLRHRVADIVLAGDTCYDRDEAKPILKWLRSQAAVGVDVLLGDSHRPHAPRSDVAIVFEMSYITTRQTDDDTLSRARVMRLSATIE